MNPLSRHIEQLRSIKQEAFYLFSFKEFCCLFAKGMLHCLIVLKKAHGSLAQR